jgi:hypothetical protein
MRLYRMSVAARLVRVQQSIDEIEQFKREHTEYLQRLLREASHLRILLHNIDDPLPTNNTALRSLNSPRRNDGVARKVK